MPQRVADGGDVAAFAEVGIGGGVVGGGEVGDLGVRRRDEKGQHRVI